MPITIQELAALEARINATLASHGVRFVLSGHFTGDRVNHARNVPPITLAELESILNRLVNQRIGKILALTDQDTFNIRCRNSHINMPCGFSHTGSGNGAAKYEISVITVMRNKHFFAKDPIEFIV
jgi:hypothetical protein